MYIDGKVDFALKYRVSISNPSAGNFSLLHQKIQKDDAGRYICCLENTACSGQMLQYSYTVYVNGLLALSVACNNSLRLDKLKVDPKINAII